MPIKRNEFLKAISREHHHGLLLCWKIRAGLKKEVNLIRTNELNQHEKNFFRRELAKHISEEEMKNVYKNRDLFLQGK